MDMRTEMTASRLERLEREKDEEDDAKNASAVHGAEVLMGTDG